MIEIDKAEVKKAIEILKPNNQLFEVRIIKGKKNLSGYFTSADKLIEELSTNQTIPRDANIYITLNAINEACYSRGQRDMFCANVSTTSDIDINGYDWLMIDLDPKRASGVSSSNEELQKAKAKANEIYKYLEERGWEKPVVALSGNGVHLLYRINFSNIPKRVELVKNVLLALDMLFSDEDIDVDTSTFNLSRICKLYGTKACKGSDTEERPHRMSKIQYVPAEIKINDINLLRELVSILPEKEQPAKVNNYNPKSFDLESWISEHGLKVKEKTTWSGGTKWILEECPFDSSHKGKDAAIIQTNDGKICFNCFHNSCSGNHWKELRLKYEPDAYDKQYVDPSIKPNHTSVDYSYQNYDPIDEASGEPVFYTPEQIRQMETPPEEFIKTGISEIDRLMRGLKKGFVTCLSGLRASGKSSILSQITLNAAKQGYRTAMFSGELTAKNTLKWLELQAAGKSYVEPTQFDNYYVVPEDIEKQITEWLDDKVYIYNNDYSNDARQVLDHMEDVVIEHKVDLIILDNLMALNIETFSNDKFDRQSQFVDTLERFAKKQNVHIILVAHPRKSMGLMRLEDVSGSNDIVNRVDNAFILHRVNDDFKRLAKQTLGWKDKDQRYECDNIIEICKDRDGGRQDVWIKLWFEPESKRLKNRPSENKVYLDLHSDMPFM